MIFVSSCLMGHPCKYNGGNNKNEAVIAYVGEQPHCLICPESFGGLLSPRPPAEIQGERVINAVGEDVTSAFLCGAEKVLALAKKENPDLCILKENSPSCGVHQIYDGTFRGKKIEGMGLTARLLQEHGYTLCSEKDIIAQKK